MKPFILPFSFLLSLTITSYFVIAIHSSSCPTHQRDALLQLKNSFSITEPPPTYSYCMNTSYPKTASWREDNDCCSWEGVACDNSTGDIIGLDLSCALLRGKINSNNSMFYLRQLRSISLFGNDLIGSSIPPEISVFSDMTYLNLSSSNISGNVPTEISQLSKLVSLDLSYNSILEMQNPTMRMLVSNLTQLEDLHLAYVDMSAVVPTSLMNFSSSLISLHLDECSLEGRFPDYIFQLPNLQELNLSLNYDLHGTLPKSNWSSSLTFLSLKKCSFVGAVPNSMGTLTRLTFLDLSWNNFTGDVDFQTFSSLENLRSLTLSGLSVSGENAMDASNKFPKLEILDISDGSLKNFPCFLSSMPQLRELSLSQSIVSEFPGTCAINDLSFPHLQELDMYQCNLTKFPSILSQSNKLIYLDLGGNRIKDIPSWFWGIGIDTLQELDLGENLIRGGVRLPWKRLEILNLENNSFQGPLPIPTSRSISYFILSQNRFNGSIPLSICQLTRLLYLELGQNNLMGVIPQCLGNLTDLRLLDLSRNSLTGPLPPSLLNCTSMVTLDVSYNSIGDTSPIWVPTGSLQELRLQDNNFVGRWPVDIFLSSTSLWVVDLSSNRFEGPIPLPSYVMRSYSVLNNSFSGEISPLLCNATNLNLFDMSNNDIIGTLPHCLKNITMGLLYLNIRANKLQGLLPEIFHEGCTLTSVDFSRNQFNGTLPRSLSNCTMLEVLDVGSNKIVDSFPDWLGDLPLKILNLRSNNFHGGIGYSKGTRSFSELHILDLSNNSFDGSLHDKFISDLSGMMQLDKLPRENLYMGDFIWYNVVSNLSYSWNSEGLSFYSVMINLKGVEIEMFKINIQFVVLDLSSNFFEGEIPRNIGSLISLMILNLSQNSFTGKIPQSIENLTRLESLDLSSNHLVGEIPKELVKLTFLETLNLSRNNLTGLIPSGGHFNTFSNSSFDGNLGLWGIPLTRECSEAQPQLEQEDDREAESGGWLEWKFVVMGFGSGLGIGITLGYMALEMGRPLWLTKMVMKLEGSGKKRFKRKGTKRNGRRSHLLGVAGVSSSLVVYREDWLDQ